MDRNLQHYVIIISRFFKWLYYPDLPPKERQLREKPAVIDNITKIKKKGKIQFTNQLIYGLKTMTNYS